MSRCLIIAEAGVNHNGSLDLALELVEAAVKGGADVVKFQTFKGERLASARARRADYQLRNTGETGSQLEMLKKLELSENYHFAVAERCRKLGIAFMSTPFDVESLKFLSAFEMPAVKISSGDVTTAPLLLEIARTGRKAILSTGMSTLDEVRMALSILAFGYTVSKDVKPDSNAFAAAFSGDAGQKKLRERVTILHCTTEYPAPYAETNLKAMDTIGKTFGLPVGLSDHTPGIHIPIAAVARGACMIEKHFTLDRTLPGPDHAASLEPAELGEMVRSIRDVEAALGDGEKRPMASELKNRDVARKSLVAAKAIRAGESFSAENLTTKRPGSGVSPLEYWNYLGRAASRDYEPDEVIEP